MKIFAPYRGEFGFVVMAHAPQVHAALVPDQDIVCCESGNECLYPGAREYVAVDRRPDGDRRVFLEHGFLAAVHADMTERFGPDHDFVEPDMDAPRAYFVPDPVFEHGIRADVVICPRRREYGPDKNWPHWQRLADALFHGGGLKVFAAGAPDASYDVDCGWPQSRAWDFDRFLDATVEAMKSAALVVATDNGLAHLALLCGRPLAILTHRFGIVAPGADDQGRPYWPVHMDRFRRENHRDAPVRIIPNAWDDPDGVVREIGRFRDDLRGMDGWNFTT